MSVMTYKGYTARIEYDAADHILVGRLLGIRDVVCFHGASVPEVEEAFRESVDDYLDACEKLGQKPNKTASGKMMLRVDPRIHQAALIAAEAEGKSLNQWAAEAIGERAGVVS